MSIFLDSVYWILDVSLYIYFAQKYLVIKTSKYCKACLILVPLFVTFVMMVSEPVIGEGNLLTLIVMLVLSALPLQYLYQNPFRHILLLLFWGLIVIGIIEMLSVNALVLILGTTMKNVSEDAIGMAGPILLTKGVTFLSIRYLHSLKFDLYKINRTITYQLLLLATTSLFLICIGLTFYKYTTLAMVNVTLFSLALAGAIILFCALMLGVTRKIIDYTEREYEWKYKEQRYQEQIKHVQDFDDIFKQLKAQRHEYGNQLQCIYGLINQNKIEATRQYLEGLNQNLETVDSIVVTSNAVLSSLLNVKYTIASNKGIQMDYQVSDLNLDQVEFIDLTILIGNILDNAIEACEKLPEANRKVQLKVYNKNHNLCIVAVNEKDPNQVFQGSSGYTTKDEREYHGFGLSNIDHVVKKYGGYLKLQDKGNSFVLQIALPNSCN